MGPNQAILAVRCASQRIMFAMQCILTAICALAAEIHCDAGHDASIIASAMLRCAALSSGTNPKDPDILKTVRVE